MIDAAAPPPPAAAGGRLFCAAALACRVLAWLALGLTLGFLGAAAYGWAKYGDAAGPRLMQVLLEAGMRLPRTSWVGLEQALEWALVRSVFLCAGLALALVWVVLTLAAVASRRVCSAVMYRRLVAAVRETAMEPRSGALPDPTASRILRAYAQLERQHLREKQPAGDAPERSSKPAPSAGS